MPQRKPSARVSRGDQVAVRPATVAEAPVTAAVPGEAGAPPAPPGPLDAPSLDLRVTAARIETISLIFDPFWYLWKYRDVEIAGLDPVQHYFADGHREGRDPNPFFNTAWYLSNNPDVSGTGTNPFLHYILYGAREGRKPRP